MATKISVTGVAEPIEVGKYLLGFTPSGEPDVATRTGPETAERIPRQPGAPEVARCRQTRTVDDRHARSLFAPAGCMDHFVCDEATGRDAQSESDRRAVRRVRLGDEPEAGGRANQSRTPARRTGPGLSIGKQSRLRSHAFADAGFHRRVLRSGHLAHAGNQMPNDLLAIDLSSERVRLATWLLDGVRQGQPLGALLGYRFERRLQEAGKAQFISFFRELAPLVARKLEQPTESTGRSHRRQQRRGRPGACSAAGRQAQEHSPPPGSTGH